MTDSAPDNQRDGAKTLNTKWITIGAAGVVVVAAVTGLGFWLAASKSVTAQKLPALLLGSEQISAAMGAGMTTGELYTEPQKTNSGLSKPECLGALTAAQELTYTDSGYTDLRRNEARNSGEQVNHYVAQSVARFPDAGQADAFVKNAAAQWRVCADQSVVTMSPDKSVTTWRIGAIVGLPPKISVSESREDVKWTCQRAMRAASNVVVDVTACAAEITDQGRKIGDQILANVPK